MRRARAMAGVGQEAWSTEQWSLGARVRGAIVLNKLLKHEAIYNMTWRLIYTLPKRETSRARAIPFRGRQLDAVLGKFPPRIRLRRVP